MIQTKLTFRNVQAVAANLYAVDPVMQREARKLVKDAARYLHDLTYFLAPYKTGFMREHIRIVYGTEGLSFEVGWWEEDFIAAGLAFYPIYQEYGTRNMVAQPSLTPAHADMSEWFIPALSTALHDAIERMRSQP